MFVYPDNVAFPFGGDRFEYLVMEIHYDNPDLKQGIEPVSVLNTMDMEVKIIDEMHRNVLMREYTNSYVILVE